MDNPLVDDVDVVSRALGMDTVGRNYPGANAAFGRIVDALRNAQLYRYPGEAPPERTTQSKRKVKRARKVQR